MADFFFVAFFTDFFLAVFFLRAFFLTTFFRAVLDAFLFFAGVFFLADFFLVTFTFVFFLAAVFFLLFFFAAVFFFRDLHLVFFFFCTPEPPDRPNAWAQFSEYFVEVPDRKIVIAEKSLMNRWIECLDGVSSTKQILLLHCCFLVKRGLNFS